MSITRRNKWVLMVAIAIGHGIQHLYLQGFLMFLPLIKTDMGLSPIQSSLLVTSRNFLGGTLNFPLGVLSDILYKHWRIILAGTTIWAGGSYLLLGLAPNYLLILFSCSLIGVSSMAWHHLHIITADQESERSRNFNSCYGSEHWGKLGSYIDWLPTCCCFLENSLPLCNSSLYHLRYFVVVATTRRTGNKRPNQ